MMRRVYYLALLKLGNWECPRYQWYADLIDMDLEEETRLKIQAEHMNNRLINAFGQSCPFNITWKLGNVEHFTYEI